MRGFRSKHLYAIIVAVLIILIWSVGCKENPVGAEESLSLSNQDLAKHGGSGDEDVFGMPFADAEVFFEFNSTDNDLGLQIFLDAEGWRQVKVSDPRKQKIVQIMTEGKLSDLGITELRFESAEPSPAEVLALFPAGEYTFRGKTVEDGKLYSTATLSQDLLPAPTFSPSDGDAVDAGATTVTWNAPGAEQVEIIISNEETDATLDVTVSAPVTSLDIPPQFLQADSEYKIEILSIAENGNKTITESNFVTLP